MEPAAGESQLVPRAAEGVPARDTVRRRAALGAVVAASVVILTLAVLVGKWLRACLGSRPGWQRRPGVARGRRVVIPVCVCEIEGCPFRPPRGRTSRLGAGPGLAGALPANRVP